MGVGLQHKSSMCKTFPVKHTVKKHEYKSSSMSCSKDVHILTLKSKYSSNIKVYITYLLVLLLFVNSRINHDSSDLSFCINFGQLSSNKQQSLVQSDRCKIPSDGVPICSSPSWRTPGQTKLMQI